MCRKREKKFIRPGPLDPITSYIRFGIDNLTISNEFPLIIVDYGSSHGKASIRLIKSMLEYIHKSKNLHVPTIVIHNDLPENDWQEFFKYLIEDKSYPGLASGRSFFDQCLPSNTLVLGVSTASLHYLSQIPCPIQNHCYIQFGDTTEYELFRAQAELDWHQFIENRSRELRTNGILILSVPSRHPTKQMGFDFYFDLIFRCARSSSIFTEQELLDFTVPFYLRSFDECIDETLFTNCSLQLIEKNFTTLNSTVFDLYHQGNLTRNDLAKSITLLMRPGTDSALKKSLKLHGRALVEIDRLLKTFWTIVEEQIGEEISDTPVQTYATYLILKKI